MSGHGHVTPNADGSRASCGGPGLCADCSREAGVAYALAAPQITADGKTHKCVACPIEFRNLYALAHNAVVNYGSGREQQQMAKLKKCVESYAPLVDAHFACVNADDPVALRAEIERLKRERDEYIKPAPTEMPGELERRS